ncbi:hypothetical protein [Catenovulum sediminis]|uniref:Uncharacterized protein n=1 Tax=Catenovulum sediminis TaxID=1740262 RepID=A0ABV1RJX5_9ALTE|nr:hypothetical protein [Catenovulum sediminis]
MQFDLPVIIDIEASGFGRGSYPIEIGLALPNQVRYCRLIKPLEHWTHWDKNAESVHHISKNLLFCKGGEVQQVALELNQLLQGKTVYSDAWGHDSSWLGLLFEEAGMVAQFKLESIVCLLSDAQQAIWHTSKLEILKRNPEPRHRASNDAALIQKTFEETLYITDPSQAAKMIRVA